MIYIVRHGQTLWNNEERKQGQKDSPLTVKGIRQAEAVGDLLRREKVRERGFEFYVSPQYRSLQSWQIIQERLGAPVHYTIEHNLREHGFGSWEGKTQQEVDAQFPGETEKRMNNRWEYIIPGGGESYKLIYNRAAFFLSGKQDQNLVVVSHEMISKVMRGVILGLSEEAILDLGHPQNVVYKIENGQISELTFSLQ